MFEQHIPLVKPFTHRCFVTFTGNVREMFEQHIPSLKPSAHRYFARFTGYVLRILYLAALPVEKSFGLQPLQHLSAPGFCRSLTRLGHQFVRTLAIAIDVQFGISSGFLPLHK